MSRLIPLVAASALFVFLEAWCQVPASKSQPAAGAIIQNPYLLYAIGTDGRNQRFIDRRTGRNYALPNSACALVKRGAKDFPATSATFKDGLLKLQFAGTDTEAVIRVQIQPTHLLYE